MPPTHETSLERDRGAGEWNVIAIRIKPSAGGSQVQSGAHVYGVARSPAQPSAIEQDEVCVANSAMIAQITFRSKLQKSAPDKMRVTWGGSPIRIVSRKLQDARALFRNALIETRDAPGESDIVAVGINDWIAIKSVIEL